MDITSFEVLEFAALAAACYNLFRALIWRQAVLLVANICFLATISQDPKAFLPTLVFLAFGYAGIHLVQRWRSTTAFVLFVGAVILLFVYLKQYKFLPKATFLPYAYVTAGLSYIFFRVVHMIVDARGGTLPQRVGLIPYLNYTLNFTTLIAGPIQLYPEFAATQLGARPSLTIGQCAVALERIVRGLIKLRVFSMVLIVLHGAAIGRLSVGQSIHLRLLTAAAIVTLYPVYLYFNFSGYVDLMIGLARFLRFGLPQNFNRPFASYSFIEFWSRWHITLSSWLKTYVYFPILTSLMEKIDSASYAPFLGVFAFFVTFFLVGAWHGQTSEFLFFGVLQGLGVSLNKLYQVLLARVLTRKQRKALDSNPVYCAFTRGLTFTYFAFTLIWFWADWRQIRSIADILTLKLEIVVWLLIWLGATLILTAWETARTRLLAMKWDGPPLLLMWPVRVAWAVYLIAIALTMLSFVDVPTPVLYQIF